MALSSQDYPPGTMKELVPPEELLGSHTHRKPQLGVSFSCLQCFGFSASSRYQKTLGSYVLLTLEAVASIFRLRRVDKTQILYDLEGIIRPGEMLLVLGRPGSGCSTFLKTLAGDVRGFHISKEAVINYQGYNLAAMKRKLKDNRVYLSELDVHFPELTLGQTLTFATSTRNRYPTKNAGKTVASFFGLDTAFDTKVGNAAIRGISGGEKRRTSIAEAFISGAQIQCWDNSTRGLDSWTSQRFINVLRASTTSLNLTVFMSLYQVPERVYKSFDKVIVLYEGRQIYYGPVGAAESYFTALGFVRPPRSTTADFLTSLTSPVERNIRPGFENITPDRPDDFANLWKHSEQAVRLRDEIERFNSDHPLSEGESRESSFAYPLPVHSQVILCMKRATQRIRNNIGPILAGVVANVVLGIIIGSVFYDISQTTESLQQRSILLFFAVVVNAFIPAVEVSLMYAQRPIVEKHHRYTFYHPFTERLASLICDLPAKLVTCIGLHIPIYFLANLRRSAGAFFTYGLFMLTNLMAMTMLFRAIGSISRTREQTIAPVAILALLCTIYTGFVVPPSYMVPWLKWFWRINPVAYTYESLMLNEFRDRQFYCSNTIPRGPSYESIPITNRSCTTVGSEIGRTTVQGSRHLAVKYEYFSSHLWRNLGILLAMIIVFCVVHLVAAEYVPAKPSRGEVLLFKRTNPRKGSTPQDEEKGITAAGECAINKNQTSSHSRDVADIVAHDAAVLSWRHLDYEITQTGNKRNILHNISGWVKPGTLTALMGATGAGKTTLLDVLSHRASVGTIRGEIIMDGHSHHRSSRRRMGYVQQNDIHLPTATVREALQFSALLRQSATKGSGRSDKLRSVDEVLKMVEMEKYADAIVGVPGEGLNVDQRKRLTIAMELVAKPDLVLFLDEPTSGLDSQTAWSICSLLRRLADNGHTILCTIHQPSSQLFCIFDRLLLLDRGEQLYFGDIGPDASTMIAYFEVHGAQKCPPGENPAEWVMELAARTTDTTAQRAEEPSWSETWNSSQEQKVMLRELENSYPLTTGTGESPKSSKHVGTYATPYTEQFFLVTKRIFQDQWRDPVYLACKMSLCIGLGLVNGISFYKSPNDIQGVTSLLFSIFLITQLFGSIDRLVIPRFFAGRELFETRERDSEMYSWVVLIAANILVESFWQAVMAAPVFASWYYPTGLYRNGNTTFGTAERGGLTFLLILVFNLWASTLAQAFAAGFGKAETAMHLVTLCFWLTLVFCGVLVPPQSLPRFWIFLYRVSPLTYFLEGLAIAGLADMTITCSSVEAILVDLPSDFAAQTCGQFLAPFVNDIGGSVLNPEATTECQYCPVTNANDVLAIFGMETDHAWRNLGLMVVYIISNLSAIFLIYWIARVPRKGGKRQKP